MRCPFAVVLLLGLLVVLAAVPFLCVGSFDPLLIGTVDVVDVRVVVCDVVLTSCEAGSPDVSYALKSVDHLVEAASADRAESHHLNTRLGVEERTECDFVDERRRKSIETR